jgi:hypothetical protein
MTGQLSYSVFCLKEEVWESKWEFGGAVGYIGELWKNQERLGRTLHLPWVYHVRTCFRLLSKLLPNYLLLLVRC